MRRIYCSERVTPKKLSATTGSLPNEGIHLRSILVTYLRGDGVESDLDEGERLLERAAAKGDDHATHLLEGLRAAPDMFFAALHDHPRVFGPPDHK